MDSKYDQWNSVKKRIALSNHKTPYFKYNNTHSLVLREC